MTEDTFWIAAFAQHILTNDSLEAGLPLPNAENFCQKAFDLTGGWK
jgi:hypothetical protein